MLRLEEITFTTQADIRLKAFSASFQVVCKLLPTDRLRDIEAGLRNGTVTTEQFVDEFHVGWPEGEVQAADGQALEPTPENMQRLRARPGALVALVEAFYKGYDRATEGNSEPLPAA